MALQATEFGPFSNDSNTAQVYLSANSSGQITGVKRCYGRNTQPEPFKDDQTQFSRASVLAKHKIRPDLFDKYVFPSTKTPAYCTIMTHSSLVVARIKFTGLETVYTMGLDNIAGKLHFSAEHAGVILVVVQLRAKLLVVVIDSRKNASKDNLTFSTDVPIGALISLSQLSAATATTYVCVLLSCEADHVVATHFTIIPDKQQIRTARTIISGLTLSLLPIGNTKGPTKFDAAIIPFASVTLKVDPDIFKPHEEAIKVSGLIGVVLPHHADNPAREICIEAYAEMERVYLIDVIKDRITGHYIIRWKKTNVIICDFDGNVAFLYEKSKELWLDLRTSPPVSLVVFLTNGCKYDKKIMPIAYFTKGARGIESTLYTEYTSKKGFYKGRLKDLYDTLLHGIADDKDRCKDIRSGTKIAQSIYAKTGVENLLGDQTYTAAVKDSPEKKPLAKSMSSLIKVGVQRNARAYNGDDTENGDDTDDWPDEEELDN
jgi:hypothetical protein